MSYRQSLYPGASTSGLGNSSTTPSPSAINSLVDKQRQVQHFHQILKHSENLLRLYQGYADKYNVLVGGSEGKTSPSRVEGANASLNVVRVSLVRIAVGDVVEHWQNVFRSTSLALGKRETLPLTASKIEVLILLFSSSARTNPGSIQEQKRALSTPDTRPDQVVLPKNSRPDQLVRLPVEPDSNLAQEGDGQASEAGDSPR